MSKFKAILLDADGVVIKNHRYFSERFREEFGKVIPKESEINFFKNEYKLCAVGKADLKEELSKKLSEWGWERSVEDLMEYWFKGEREQDRELLKTVKDLQIQGIKVYLVSDNEKYRAEYLLKEVGLKEHFDRTFFSCYLGAQKSDPAFFKAVVKELGVSPGQILYFDDDQKNVDVAKTAGINAKLYTNAKVFRNFLESSKLI